MFKTIRAKFPSTLVLLTVMASANLALAQSSAAKTELVTRILQMQRPALEGLATVLAQQPAQQMMQQASIALQTRVAPDKREAIAKEIQADLKKYVDDTVPLVRERAVKLGPVSVGALLEEKFSEDELRELIKIMESPVNKKFSQLNGEMQKALSEKLVAETRPVVEPKVKALEASIAKRLGIQPLPGSGPAAATPAKPANK
jgi:hypothetical protein